jgi:hypothetical protein
MSAHFNEEAPMPQYRADFREGPGANRPSRVIMIFEADKNDAAYLAKAKMRLSERRVDVYPVGGDATDLDI